MTPKKPRNPDAITWHEAAELLGVGKSQLRRYRRDGLLGTLDGYPSYSRSEIQAIVSDPWLSGKQAAEILGVSHTRVSQLALGDRIPSFEAASGRRYYRHDQLMTVANARRARRYGFSIG